MKRWRMLFVALCVTAGLIFGFNSRSHADDVNLYPGYIAGTVSMGEGFAVNSISLNAIGGGYSSYKSVYNSKDYSLTLQSGEWDYAVTASARLSGGGGTTSVSFSPRSLRVASNETVTNNYTNAGLVRFHVNITGDAYTAWGGYSSATKSASPGQEKTSSNTSSRSFTTNGIWEMPVVPNQQIKITANVGVNPGRYYSFDLGYKDIAPGQVVDINLNVEYVKPPEYTPPPYTPPPYVPPTIKVGSVEGTIWLSNVDGGDFLKHALPYGPYPDDGDRNASSLYANPGAYHLNYYLEDGNSSSDYLEPTSYFTDGSYLDWPYTTNGYVLIEADQTKTKDLIREAGKLTGKFTLRGAVRNDELSFYSLSIGGISQIYDFVSGRFVASPAFGGYAGMQRTGAAVARGDYRLYLTEGPWSLRWISAEKRPSSYQSSYLSFLDYTQQYDGYYYTGTPLYIRAGETTVYDFDYCLGSVVFRFRDTSGKPMSRPNVSGSAYRYSSNGKLELSVSASASNYSSNAQSPEAEIFGPPADYSLRMNVIAADGTAITYPPRNKTLICGVKEIIDIPGPILRVEHPAPELITNAETVTVDGLASGPAGITQVTVNGQTAVFASTGNPSDPLEAEFAHGLVVDNGRNTITTTAMDTTGARATDERTVYVDRWVPTVSITTLANGDRFPNSETSIQLTVQAADRGYGYNFEVYFDGTRIHTAPGAADDATQVPLSYAGSLTSPALGNHTITAIATDLAGNSSTTSITVVIYEAKDDTPPVITRIGAATETVEAGNNYTDAGATASDDRDGDITSRIVVTNPVDTLVPGTYIVRYNASDTAGNPAVEVTRTVIVADTTPPLLTVPADKTVEATGPQTPVEIGEATATDIFTPVTITNNAPASYGIGTTTVTWTAKDANNLPASKEQKITVLDTTAPVVTPPASITVEATGPLTQVNIATATATDAVGVVSITSNAPAAGYPLGATTVTWAAKDAAGNSGTAPQIITVIDTTAPVLTVPANMLLEATSPAGAPATFSVTAADPVDPAPAITCSAVSGSTFPLGETTITCTAMDFKNNSVSKTFTVTVQDTTPPVLTVPADRTVEATGPQTQVTIGNASATDIFTPVTITNNEPATYGIGTTTVSWTARDANNLATSMDQKITVQDTTAPVVTPPPDITIEATGPLTQVNIGTATASDAVGVVSLTNNAPAAGYPLGTTTITWTGKDAADNTGTATQTITVVDTTPPALVIPANMVLEATSTAGAQATFTVSATDLVDPLPAVTCSAASGSTFSLGVTTVTCTATDFQSNSVSKYFTITVQDTTPPVLTVPADKTVEATGPKTPVEIGEATATDIFTPVTITNNAPASYGIGTTTVTWTAKDANNLPASKEQKITVLDTTAPVVTPPASITVEATGPLTQVNIGTATATDAVGVVSLTSNAPAAGYPLGTTTVTWTATDAAGNSGMADQTVTVVDTTAPILNVPADIVLEATSAAGATATFSVTATDLVDPAPVVTCSSISGSTFPLGETTVSCTSTDAKSNSTTGDFTVTVRDTTPPALTVPSDITVLLNTPVSSPTVQAFLGGATAIDIVDATVTITSTAPAGLNTVGAKQVTFTAVDDFGNTTTLTAAINVVYGCGDEFLAPVNLLKPFKLGSTIPVKIGLCDAFGTTVTTAVARLFLYPFSGDTPSEEPIEIYSTSNADIDNYFRVSESLYIYNLGTKNLSSGTYQIRAVLDDGTIRTSPLALKQ